MPERSSYHHGSLAEALLFAATQAVREDGAHKVSVRAIARELGVDVASVYRHYKNKQALLDAVVAGGLTRMAAMMEAEVAGGSSEPPARLASVGRGYVLFALEEPELFQLVFGPMRTPSLLPEHAAPYLMLVDSLLELERAGLCRLPVDIATVVAWSAVHGLASLSLDGTLTRAQAYAAIEPTLSVVTTGLGAMP